MKLSIIVPIYNLANYLEDCLKSLGNQDMPNQDYEIICVNDGSEDNSEQIIKKMQFEIANIVLVNQHNQGVSIARNNGLDLATGEYVMFIDGDDQLMPNCLLSLYGYAKRFEIQICNYKYFSESKYENRKSHLSRIIENFSPVENYLHGRLETIDSSCTHLYQRELLQKHNIKFDPNIIFLEDGEFLIRAYFYATRVASLDFPIYKRTFRDNSTTRTNVNINKKAVKGYLIALLKLIVLYENNYKNCNSIILEQGIVKFSIHYLSFGLRKNYFLPIVSINFLKALKTIRKYKFREILFSPIDYRIYYSVMRKGFIFLYFYILIRHIKYFLFSRIKD